MSLFNHVTVDDPRWEVMFVELEDEDIYRHPHPVSVRVARVSGVYVVPVIQLNPGWIAIKTPIYNTEISYICLDPNYIEPLSSSSTSRQVVKRVVDDRLWTELKRLWSAFWK
jgi:hypothetical protein